MAEQNSYIVRGNDICFGLDGVTVPWGVVTSVKRKPSRSSEKFVGESGNTESVVYWDPQETVTLDVLRGGKHGQKASSLPVPQIGDKVEFESKNYYVENLDDSRERTGAQKYTVELLHLPFVKDPVEPAQEPAQAENSEETV